MYGYEILHDLRETHDLEERRMVAKLIVTCKKFLKGFSGGNLDQKWFGSLFFPKFNECSID